MDQQNRLYNAIKNIIALKGFNGLGINAIAKESGVSKGFIYNTYGNVENLLEAYFKTKDYWSSKVKKIEAALSENEEFKTIDLVNFYLINQYKSVVSNEDLKELIIQSIKSKDDPFMKKFISEREKTGEHLFEKIKHKLKDPDLIKSYRAASAINVAALYFLSCHFSANNGTFCGLDLNKEEDLNEVFKVIETLNSLYFR